MRDLSIKASPWQLEALPVEVRLPDGVVSAVLESCRLEQWRYQRLLIETASESSCYLYVDDGEQAWVLGVFDTLGQADFFLALHNQNPLFVPALLLAEPAPAVQVLDGCLAYPVYAGVYRVGFKSYNVEVLPELSGSVRADYIDHYRVESLGEGPEKEMCLQIYSHFDGRLRGCKMC